MRSEKIMRGLFVTFEGPDGGGKSTQLKRAAQALRNLGYSVLESREPGGTQLAEQVRSLVLDAKLPLSNTTQTLLYLAARSEHVDKVLRPALQEGKIVLCDRFGDSTVVYQGLAVGASAADVDKLQKLNKFAAAGIMPQLTLLLDGDPAVLETRRTLRGVTDRYEEKGLAFQQALRDGFLVLAQQEPERIRVINAEADTESVHREIMAALLELINRK